MSTGAEAASVSVDVSGVRELTLRVIPAAPPGTDRYARMLDGTGGRQLAVLETDTFTTRALPYPLPPERAAFPLGIIEAGRPEVYFVPSAASLLSDAFMLRTVREDGAVVFGPGGAAPAGSDVVPRTCLRHTDR